MLHPCCIFYLRKVSDANDAGCKRSSGDRKKGYMKKIESTGDARRKSQQQDNARASSMPPSSRSRLESVTPLRKQPRHARAREKQHTERRNSAKPRVPRRKMRFSLYFFICVNDIPTAKHCGGSSSHEAPVHGRVSRASFFLHQNSICSHRNARNQH